MMSKKVMLITFVLLALLTIGAVSASDDAIFDEAMTVDTAEEVSADASLDENIVSEGGDDEEVAASEDEMISDGNSTIVPQDDVIIYVENGMECQYNLNSQDDSETYFAWVSVPNGLNGSIAIFTSENDDKVFFFNKQLHEIEDYIADGDIADSTRYFIHFTDIDELNNFKSQEGFTLAFIEGEDNIIASCDYEIDYDEANNIIKFWDAGTKPSSPIYPMFDFAIDPVVYPNDLIINIIAPNDATGTVYLYFNGSMYTSSIVFGSATLTISGVDAGFYPFAVAYSGDENYLNATWNLNATVLKANSSFALEKTAFYYAEEIEVNFTLVGAYEFDCEAIDCPEAEVSWEDVVYLRYFPVGTHVVQFTTVPDENHNAVVVNYTITIMQKPELPLTLVAEDVNYGEDLVAVVSADRDVEVYFKLDDGVESPMIVVQIENGTVSLNFGVLDSGVHLITVVYPGNEDYAKTAVSRNVTVNKADSSISLDNFVVSKYGETAYIAFTTEDAIGINASVVEYPGAEIIYSSEGILINGLPAGNYTLKAVTVVDKNHNSAEATAYVIVERVIVTNANFNEYFDENGQLKQEFPELVFEGTFENKVLNINKPVTLVGDNAKLNNVHINIISDDVTVKNMEFNYRGSNPASVADDPVISVVGVSNVVLDNNIIVSNTFSDDKVAAVLVNNSNDVFIANNDIKAYAKAFVDCILVSNSNYTIENNTLFANTGDSAEGISIIDSGVGNVADNKITVISNSTSIDFNQGVVYGINTTIIKPTGNYSIKFTRNGINCEGFTAVGINDDAEFVLENIINIKSYLARGIIVNTKSTELCGNKVQLMPPLKMLEVMPDGTAFLISGNNVKAHDNEIDSFDKSFEITGKSATLTVNVANAPFFVYSPDVFITENSIVTDQDNAVIIGPEAYNVVVHGNDLNANGKTGNDAVEDSGTGTIIQNNKGSPLLNIQVIPDIFEGQSVVIVITADSNFTDAVRLQVGNNNYTVNVVNGTCSREVSADRLSVGEVLVKVSFDGNEKYSNGTKNTTFTVKAKAATAIKATAVTTTYGTSKNIVVKLTDANGNALANQNVTVVLNGAKKELKTDAKGQVSYAIGTKLAPKTYTATIAFAGDVSHVKSTGSAKVVVKKAKAKLTAKNKAFKVKKTKKYTIVLKTDKGKALSKGMVTITIKAKGKTVKVTVKTNSKGKATFNLKKLTKTGKFTATVKFAGNKYYDAVSKKVKITIKK